jgi:RNA polymerase sigma factor (sigma-70 family)
MTDDQAGDVIDVAALYPAWARRLEALVASRVPAPAAVIEDACQVAWGRLLRHRHRVPREKALSWLTTTAVRATLRALEHQQRDLSLDNPAHSATVLELPTRRPGPERLTELREQLAEIRVLPVRQQRIVWLHGLGFDYAEIAGQTGDTTRTVQRQLLRARQTLRSAAA